jgi:hypothetical protein
MELWCFFTYCNLLISHQLKGCHFRDAAEIEVDLKNALLVVAQNNFRNIWNCMNAGRSALLLKDSTLKATVLPDLRRGSCPRMF